MEIERTLRRLRHLNINSEVEHEEAIMVDPNGSNNFNEQTNAPVPLAVPLAPGSIKDYVILHVEGLRTNIHFSIMEAKQF